MLDVGANVGSYGQMLRAGGYTGRIVSFEPVTEAFARLQTAGWETHHVALGDHEGEAAINVAAQTHCSSFLPLNGSMDLARVETVPVRRLDSFEFDGPALLKMDVQGHEPKVIAGAEGVLDRIALVECELSLQPIYEGQCCAVDMISALADLGFRWVGFTPGLMDEASGYLLEGDGLFAR